MIVKFITTLPHNFGDTSKNSLHTLDASTSISLSTEKIISTLTSFKGIILNITKK